MNFLLYELDKLNNVQLTFQLPMFSIFDECLTPSKII